LNRRCRRHLEDFNVSRRRDARRGAKSMSSRVEKQLVLSSVVRAWNVR
jgi:hypothetical protein